MNQRRFSAGVLAATLLLGVLLYIVLGVVARLGEVPAPAPAPPGPLPAPPGVTRIASHAELVAALGARGIAPEAPLAGWRDWLAQRGFLGAEALLNISEELSRERFYDHLDEAALGALAAQSDAGALQRLAAQRRLADPAAAAALYYRAASESGSTAALLELSALYDTAARMAADDWPGAPPDEDALAALRAGAAGQDLREASLAWLLVALRDGGEPVASADRLDWAGALAGAIGPTRLNAVCNRSLNLFLQIGAARRAAGLVPVRTVPPPVFLGVTDLPARDPCATTTAPLQRVLDLEECAAEPVVDGRGRPQRLWICASALR